MTGRAWWTSRWTVPIAALAAAVPLLGPRIPPFADVPGHMASYHVSIALAHSAILQRYFAFDWQLIGNLGVDLLVIPLAKLVGVELATKLIVIAIPVLTALALLLLGRQAQGRLPAAALAAVPLAYNYPLIFGFVNYSLAAVMALFGLLLWQRWPSERHPVARIVAFAAIAAATWLAHAIGWVMLGAMCGAAELHRRLTLPGGLTRPGILRALWRTALACIGLAAPIVLMRLSQHADRGGMTGWFYKREMLNAAAGALRDRWIWWDIATAALLMLLIAAAFFRIGKLRLAPTLFWPAAALGVLFVGLPLSIDGSLYVNTRLFPYALALAVVAVDASALMPSRRSALAAAAALFCVARLAGNTLSAHLYDESYTRELAAVDYIPRGAAVLTLVEMPCKQGFSGWKRHRLEHLAGMATVRRDAFVNTLWTIKGLQLLRDRRPQAAPFESDPSEFVAASDCDPFPSATRMLRTAPLGAFTHLWLIGVPPIERPHSPDLAPIWTNGNSILYRITRPAG